MLNHRLTEKNIKKLETCERWMSDFSDLDKGPLMFFFCIFRNMLFLAPASLLEYIIIPTLKSLHRFQRSIDPKVQEEEKIEREKWLEEQRKEWEIRDKMLESHEGFYLHAHRDICPKCGKTVAVEIDGANFYCNPGGQMGQRTKTSYEHYKPDTKEICRGFSYSWIIQPGMRIF